MTFSESARSFTAMCRNRIYRNVCMHIVFCSGFAADLSTLRIFKAFLILARHSQGIQ